MSWITAQQISLLLDCIFGLEAVQIINKLSLAAAHNPRESLKPFARRTSL